MQDFFKVSGIKKSFVTKDGEIPVLGGIDFEVREKEFICIMGASGCGKSTLIRTMEGIETPDEGEVILEGQKMPQVSSKEIQKKFGIVFQNDNLLEWKTVYENVRLPLQVFGMKKQKDLNIEKQITKMLDLVGLQEFKDCLPKELSGGMRQRAAIARALVTDPDLFMLDQPFGALDAITRKMLNVELLKIWNETKKTCVMITNNVNEALYLGQRVLVMSHSPARIIHNMEIPFTYEERKNQLELNPEYLELRAKLNDIVRTLN
ncbi:MAG: ABC transporter ATP-binding protein [Lachnospiraceae bacterium]